VWVHHTVTSNFYQIDYLKLFQPRNMPEAPKFDESRMLEACAVAQAKKKPNISKIAREYGVPYQTLQNCVKSSSQAHTAQKLVNKVLKGYQEEALIR
jgi:predicted transcriptional regulator